MSARRRMLGAAFGAAIVLGPLGDAYAAATCYRLPFNNPNLKDGWGSTCCGRKSPHRGVDFPQRAGTPIPAIAEGVVRVKAYSSCLGNVVVVEHPDGAFSGYCHMTGQSPLAVGAHVNMSDIVGNVGGVGTCATGPHLHLTMSNQVGGWAAGATFDPYAYIQAHKTCNQEPRGWFDKAACDGIAGWAQDLDVPNDPINVHLYFGGPAGDPKAYAMALLANGHRDDLCTAIGSCNHGFSTTPPLAFFDGVSRPVFAYAIDPNDGSHTDLGSKPLACDSLPIPALAGGSVRRRVLDVNALTAWHFTSVEIATIPDAALAAIPLGPDLPTAPELVAVKGAPAVYVREYETVRHVPTPEVLAAWALAATAPKAVTDADLATSVVGAPWTDKPYLVKGTDAEVYLVDAAPALWGELVDATIPTQMAPGATATATLRFRNRGSIPWAKGTVAIAPTPRDVASAVCDPSWPSCVRAGTFAQDVAPGGDATVQVTLRAPAAEGVTQACFGLVTGAHWFSAPGANGPADDATCRTITITSAAAAAGGGASDVDGGTSDEQDSPSDSAGGCACTAAGTSRHSGFAGLFAAAGAFLLAMGTVVRRGRRRSKALAGGVTPTTTE